MAELVTIYRLENEVRRGPYSELNWDEIERLDMRWHNDSRNHPSPFEDGIEVNGERVEYWNFPKHMVCGFDSFDKLTNWFTDAQIDGLEELGFILREFRIDSVYVARGEFQVLFDRDMAIEVK